MQSQKEELKREGIESGGAGSGPWFGAVPLARGVLLPACSCLPAGHPPALRVWGRVLGGPGQSGGVAPGEVKGGVCGVAPGEGLSSREELGEDGLQCF